MTSSVTRSQSSRCSPELAVLGSSGRTSSQQCKFCSPCQNSEWKNTPSLSWLASFTYTPSLRFQNPNHHFIILLSWVPGGRCWSNLSAESSLVNLKKLSWGTSQPYCWDDEVLEKFKMCPGKARNYPTAQGTKCEEAWSVGYQWWLYSQEQQQGKGRGQINPTGQMLDKYCLLKSENWVSTMKS